MFVRKPEGGLKAIFWHNHGLIIILEVDAKVSCLLQFCTTEISTFQNEYRIITLGTHSITAPTVDRYRLRQYIFDGHRHHWLLSGVKEIKLHNSICSYDIDTLTCETAYFKSNPQFVCNGSKKCPDIEGIYTGGQKKHDSLIFLFFPA